jgi:RimJ/RimL family protein N-acetyltransferase
MKTLDENKLVVRRCDPHIDSLPHKKAAQKSRGYLGSYLSWGETAPDWTIKQHTLFLLDSSNQEKLQTAYVAYYEEKFAGLFVLGLENDTFGGQICYWTPANMSGKGIATTVTDYLTEMAFNKFDWTYVVLHIDELNAGSTRVAEKCGFHVLEDYECEKNGSHGSGRFKVWIKYSPDLLKETEAKRQEIFKNREVKPRSSWHSTGTERIANDIFNNPIVFEQAQELH